MLPDDLLAQLRARAADPKTRSDALEAVQEALRDMAGAGPPPARVAIGDAAGGTAFGGLMGMVAGALLSGRGFDPQKLAERAAADVRAGRTSMADVFGGAPPGAGLEVWEGAVPSGMPRDLPAPASPGDIAAAEAALGFPLPADLKQLYAGIADGGFGPGAGFLPLAALAARYREYRAAPQGPCDETWPAHLLPVVPVDAAEACYDLGTGRIVCWDPEELVDEESEAGAWERSFRPRADSLADWLEAWLAEPPAGERAAAQHRRHRAGIARNAIAALRGMTPAERAEMGLPDEGWEAMVCRNHGADPDDVL